MPDGGRRPGLTMVDLVTVFLMSAVDDGLLPYGQRIGPATQEQLAARYNKWWLEKGPGRFSPEKPLANVNTVHMALQELAKLGLATEDADTFSLLPEPQYRQVRTTIP